MGTPRASHEIEILPVIRRVRKRWRLRILLRGLAVLLATALAAFFLSGWALEALRFSPAAVTSLRVAAWALVAGVFAAFVLRPLLRKVTDEQVALYLEEHEPSLEAAILGAVEVEKSGRGAASPELIRRLVDRAVSRARAVDYGRDIEQEGLYRSSGALGVLSLGAVAFLVLGPADLRYGARAILFPTTDAADVSPYSIVVEPGDTTVARGSDQFVRARLRGFDSDAVHVFTRSSPEAPWQRLSLIPGGTEEHEILLLNLMESTDYFVESDGVRSGTFRIEVADLPWVDRMDHTYRFPAYTGLAPRVVEDGGDVAALGGTVVEIVIHPTMDTPGGRLLVDDRAVAELVPAGDGTLRADLRVEGPGVYEIELARADGRLVPASPEYTIDVLSDQPPSIHLTRPGRDTPASPIEEVFLEARADDDYGVREVLLAYSVNGGAEDTVRLFDGRGSPLTEVTAGHTLFLEEWPLEAGDVVSYYAVARDNRAAAAGGAKEIVSDIYFIHVRPFGRAYRQAEQQGGGPPQGGGDAGAEAALSELQRQVIAATFNLLRDEDSYDRADLEENLVSVALAQGRVREQVRTLVERMSNRGLASAEERFREIAEMLPRAVADMEEAEAHLRGGEIREALGPEQRALRSLQKAEETFERFVGDSPPGGGGGGGGGANAEDLADLFELELDKLRNQYETVQRGQRQQADNEVDALMEKLKELARRQQQEMERQRRRARAQQGSAGGGGAAGQRELAEETEEAARQLERLARETRDPDLSDTARRLQEAAEAMRRSAAESGSNAGTAEAGGALDRIEEAERRLRRARDERLRSAAEDARERGRRLAESQERVQDALDRLPADGSGRREALRDIVERKESMLRETQDLERELDRLAADARGENAEAARELAGAAEGMREDKLEDKIAWSRGVVQQRDSAFVQELEEQIRQDIGDLTERLERAARTSRSASASRTLDDALERTRDLVRGTESLERRLQNRGDQGEAGNEPGEGQPGAAPGEEPEGGEGQRGGEAAEGRRGAAPGQEQPRAERGEGGGAPAEGGRAPGGTGRDPSNPAGGAAGGTPRPFTDQEIRQYRREFAERDREARELRDALREGDQPVDDLDRAIQALGRLQDPRTYGDLPQVAALQEELEQTLKRLEFVLRRQVEGANGGRASLSGSDDVPPGFRELVEEYYRSLAREGRSGGRGGG